MTISTPINEKGQKHGVWFNTDKEGYIIFMGMYVNGVDLGYWVEGKKRKVYYAK